MGHIPFLHDGALYPWSLLNPDRVRVSIAVMPDCQHLLEKDRITVAPPDQGLVFTVYSPRAFRCKLVAINTLVFFRTTIRIHKLVQYLEVSVEVNLRVWRYLLPPLEEEDGHDVMGSLPVWYRVLATPHFLCDQGKLD